MQPPAGTATPPTQTDFALRLTEQQTRHEAVVAGVREACTEHVCAVRAKCSARLALHALRAHAAEVDLWRQADAREGRMHAKLKSALRDRSPPPTATVVQWQEREEELETQLVLAAERRRRATGVFANRSQRLYARGLLLRCFLALRLSCAVGRQHAATGTWTRACHGQRARKVRRLRLEPSTSRPTHPPCFSRARAPSWNSWPFMRGGSRRWRRARCGARRGS